MAQIAVGAAIGCGFGLIRRRPLPVLAWGAVLTLGFALFLGAYAVMAWSFLSFATTHGMAASTSVPPAVAAQMIGRMLVGEGVIFLAALVFTLLRIVVVAAVWRAVLQPERGSFAYLRLGTTELLILLMMFAVGMLAYFAMLVVFVPVAISAALLLSHQWVAGVVVGAVSALAAIAGVVYLVLRFSILGPMIVSDGKLHFADTWALTRGHVASLLLTGLALFAMAMAAEFAIVALVLLVAAGDLTIAAGGVDHLTAYFQQGPAAVMAGLAPAIILCVVFAVPIAGALAAVFAAPWAQAYRDLAPPALPEPGLETAAPA